MHVWQNIEVFKECILNERMLFIKNDNTFSLKRRFLDFFSFKETKILAIIDALTNQFDHIERYSVAFTVEKKLLKKQTTPYKEFIEAADALILFARKQKKTKEIEKAILNLEVRKWALFYRLNGLDCTLCDNEIFMQLQNKAHVFKSKIPLKKEEKLSKFEEKSLKILSKHVKLAELSLNNPDILEKILEWIIEYQNPIDPYLLFPATVNKIISCGLGARIGRFGGEKLLRVDFERAGNHLQKVLTLPFEGRPINILDDRLAMDFKGGVRICQKEIFHIFSQKTHLCGDFELMAEGIVNWNSFKWGYWIAEAKTYKLVDLNHVSWWQFLEPFEKLSIQEAKKRYGGHLDGTIWNLAATATRSSLSLDLLENHVYLEVAIPNNDGKYVIFPFGKYATEIPPSFSIQDSLHLFTKMLPATICFPDDNVFALKRQFARYSVGLNKKQVTDLLNYIVQDQKQGRDDNLVYQIESENCAKCVYESLKKLLKKEELPEIFKIKFLDTAPQGAVLVFFNSIRSLPKKWQWPVMQFLHCVIGANRKKMVSELGVIVEKTLLKTEFWKTGEIFLPAMLHYKLEAGLLTKIHGASLHLRGIYMWVKQNAPQKFWQRIKDVVLYLSAAPKQKNDAYHEEDCPWIGQKILNRIPVNN
jgi:hypothetical protein